ncbi:MAG: hypothetical protein KME14_10805 [Tildeniella torsiva UHER 1998/13D]|nr:hypothetical protein [Tildeniella torsiva UHER 1998/13D]
MPFRSLWGILRGHFFGILAIFNGFPLDRIFTSKKTEYFLICLGLLLLLSSGLLKLLGCLNNLDVIQGITNVEVQHLQIGIINKAAAG